MEFGLGYSYVHIKVKEIAASIANQIADSAIPHHQLNANVTWHVPIPESLGDLQLGGNVSYKSLTHLGTDTNSLPAPGYFGSDQPAYALVDLRLQWDNIGGSNFNVGAYVKNLTDKFYRAGLVDIVSATGIGTSNYGPPRTFGATVGYKF